MFDVNEFNTKYRPNAPGSGFRAAQSPESFERVVRYLKLQAAGRFGPEVRMPKMFHQFEDVMKAFNKTLQEQQIHRGSRGGKYRVVNGRKRYDVA